MDDVMHSDNNGKICIAAFKFFDFLDRFDFVLKFVRYQMHLDSLTKKIARGSN